MQEDKVSQPTPEEHLSTISVLHQHSLGPSRKEKAIIPFVLLGLGAVLVWAGTIVYDHANRSYSPVGSVAEVVARADRPVAEPAGITGLIKPDDTRYVGLQVRSWQFWGEKGAITQNHYLVLPGLRAGSIEELVKGDRGAAALNFHIDLSRTQGDIYHVDEILRGGVETGETNLDLGIYPLDISGCPAISTSGEEGTYRESNQVAYDRTSSFKDLTRFVVRGRLQVTDGRYWIQGKNFNVALEGNWSPGLGEFLKNTANTPVSEKFTYYLTLRKAEKRQMTREIGSARIDGVLVGDLYIRNDV